MRNDIVMNEDPDVKEEAVEVDHESGQVEEELVIIPVQENWSKNVKGFSDKEAYRSSISLICFYYLFRTKVSSLK